MRSNFVRIPANLIGLAKAAAGPAGGSGRPATPSTGGTAPTGQPAAPGQPTTASTGGAAKTGQPTTTTTGGTDGASLDEGGLETQRLTDEVAGVSPVGKPLYRVGDLEAARDKLNDMSTDPNLEPEQLERQQVLVARLEDDQRREAIRRQSADNRDDSLIDWRRVDWDNSPLSGNLTVVRGERLTPAQYGYYQRKVKEYGGDKNKAWQDVQSKLNASKGHQMWVQTDEDIALQNQNRARLAQPSSGGQWYRSYGDDAQIGAGNTIRVNGAPSRELQRAAQARGMTIVSDARYYGARGNWMRAADARRAAQYQSRVNAQQNNQYQQPQSNRGRVAPLGSWGDNNFDPRLVTNLERLSATNNTTPMINYLVNNAGQIHNWLNQNYTTPAGQKVIDALFNYSGVMNDVKNSWANMSPEQQVQLKRNAAYALLRSYYGNSMWNNGSQRASESKAFTPQDASFAGAAIRGRG